MDHSKKKTVHLCDCAGSCSALTTPASLEMQSVVTKMHSQLCINGLNPVDAERDLDDTVLVSCAQEADRIIDISGDDDLQSVNLRDYVGWTDGAPASQGKLQALVQQAVLPHPPVKTKEIQSDGVALVIGSGDVAQQMVDTLSSHLSVTWLIPDPSDILMPPSGYDIITGTLRAAQGAFGDFAITLDHYQEIIPSGRGTLAWTDPVDGAHSVCDLILDLRGTGPLFPAHTKRDGYFHVDTTSIATTLRAATEASHMVGHFEKTLYIELNAPLCAHSRAEKSACSRCLDLCPTGAITSAGEHVHIDPMICAGCGACAAACPSEAITYSAHPASFVAQRLVTLAQNYLEHEATSPRLCVISAPHGTQLVAALARYGKGLPTDVIPFELDAIAQFGHAEILAAIGAGFAGVDIIMGPQADHDAINAQVALARAIATDTPIAALQITDPEALEAHLFDTHPASSAQNPILPMGGRRQISRMVAKTLHAPDTILALPDGAPYGAVLLDQDSCTLCLSCVSLCPSGALVENEDRPELRFQEDACLQCGLCATICPEQAITLEPRLNLSQSAMSAQTLKEEEPFACIECGSLFGVKSTVERITEKLSQGHSMFDSEDKLKLIQMCDTCRVNAQFHSQSSPFALGERPRPRTTEDYLKNRKH